MAAAGLQVTVQLVGLDREAVALGCAQKLFKRDELLCQAVVGWRWPW